MVVQTINPSPRTPLPIQIYRPGQTTEGRFFTTFDHLALFFPRAGNRKVMVKRSVLKTARAGRTGKRTTGAGRKKGRAERKGSNAKAEGVGRSEGGRRWSEVHRVKGCRSRSRSSQRHVTLQNVCQQGTPDRNIINGSFFTFTSTTGNLTITGTSSTMGTQITAREGSR
jgi:hypothetical protein